MAQSETHGPHSLTDARQAMPRLTEIIDQVMHVAQADSVSLRKVIAAVGGASFAPVLLLPALAVVTPLSGIPLFSSFMGIVIFLVSFQMLVRRKHLWLPDWVLRRQVKGHKVRQAFDRVRPAAAWLDARTKRRFGILVHRPLIFMPQMLCVMSGAVMPMLEFVPFSSSVMGFGVALLALGLLTRDGLIVLIGLVPYAGVGWLITSAAG